MKLDPAHVVLLCMIATALPSERLPTGVGEHDSRWGIGRGALRDAGWAVGALLDAALSTLERGGLIAGYGDREYAADCEWWTLGPYGRLFYRFLETEGVAVST